MNVRFTKMKSGKIRAEYELTVSCRPTGIWMGGYDYNTIKGAKIGMRKRFPNAYYFNYSYKVSNY